MSQVYNLDLSLNHEIFGRQTLLLIKQKVTTAEYSKKICIGLNERTQKDVSI